MKKDILFFLSLVTGCLLTSCNNGNADLSLIPVDTSKGFQFVNSKGEVIITPQFRNAALFYEDLALVRNESNDPLWGYINKKGEYVVKPTYSAATSFSEGLAIVVKKGESPAVINKKGEVEFIMNKAENVNLFHEGLAAFSELDKENTVKWGFIDKKGEVAINPQFFKSRNFHEHFCAVANKEHKWGFIDNEGKLVINYQFDDVKDFYDGKAIVRSGEQFGVIDKNGSFVINPQFDDMAVDNDLFIIVSSGKYGWCNNKGKILINPQFEVALYFSGNKLAPVSVDGKWGFINKKGSFDITPQYDYATPFFKGTSIIALESKGVGFIDDNGNYKVTPEYYDLSEDMVLFLTYKESKYNSVTSEFFNIEPIMTLLNIKTPHGITDKMTYNDILKKFNLKENDVKKSGTTSVYSYKNLSNDITYSFIIKGMPFNNATESYYDYWSWSYKNVTVKKFDGTKKPTGFEFDFLLHGKGNNKDAMVIEQIKKSLTGFQLDQDKSNEEEWYYTNATTAVTIKETGLSIRVTIDRIPAENQKPKNN